MINLTGIIIIHYYVENQSVGTVLYRAILTKNNEVTNLRLTLTMHLRGCYD